MRILFSKPGGKLDAYLDNNWEVVCLFLNFSYQVKFILPSIILLIEKNKNSILLINNRLKHKEQIRTRVVQRKNRGNKGRIIQVHFVNISTKKKNNINRIGSDFSS